MSFWQECTMTLTTGETSFHKMFKPFTIQFPSRSKKTGQQQKKVIDNVGQLKLEQTKKWGSQLL